MACKDCAEGTFWDGETTGKEVILNGLSAYVARPSGQTEKAVLLISDVYGWDLKNARLLADKFAGHGFVAALPDLFKGDKPDMEPVLRGDYADFRKWGDRHSPETVIPDLDKSIEALRSDFGIKTLGAIGFCWGGRFAVLLGGSDKVNAVVMNHGSRVDEDIIGAVKQPILINASDNDQQISREKLARFQGILDSKTALASDVKFYDGMQHGWTCRGDAADPKVGPQIVDAFERSAKWFEKHL